ncbi:MAG: hypothetical protein FJ217_10510 [Ignavibacteria bacterium]|nr:hypothetical protein [Ignavibacteria bacterium]
MPTIHPRKGLDIPPLADPFYELASLTETLPGDIVQIPSLYPNRHKYVLDIAKNRYDPTESLLEFLLRPMEVAERAFPIQRLGLASDEYYFAVKGKMRPAIVVTGGEVQWAAGMQEKIFLCIPLYTVDKPKISQKFVVRVQANQYPAYFYLFPSATFGIQESIARFELLQVVHGRALRPHTTGHAGVSLSDEAFGWVKAHLCKFLGCTIPKQLDDDLMAYGELVIEEYRRLVGG